ncbi:nucleoprotein [avian paramyxovirus 12]|uniref:Nucleocapsid n=1 Tax=avian paramyxovirus 12 TaxID=2560320 RepID=M4QTX2_9MONO|nr:nucleoprotein [Avian orthoavulavirus 12]AGH32598.1 nucleoprotein [Avian orthoavulavirus 12]
MASVFEEYDKLLESQTRPSKGVSPAEKGGTLKVELPVFVCNSNDAETRWAFVCFALRLAVSDSSNKPLRQGAMISLLCAHSETMRTHVAMAGRNGETSIALLEIDAFVDGMPVFNSRSGITDEKAQRFSMIAGDLPRSCSNNTPFINADAENDPPEDITDALERILTVQTQLWVTLAKAMTSYETAEESEVRRITKYTQQGRVIKKFLLFPVVRSSIQVTIRSSLAVRAFMVSELRRAKNTPSGSSTYYSLVGDINAYVQNAGLTAFFLTLKYGINTRTPALALSSLSGDIKKLGNLMRLYREKGDTAPYMTLLGDPDQMQFAPAEFALMYSFAMGMASVLDKGTTKYQFARDFMNPGYWRLGVECAQQQSASIDEAMAAELRLSGNARKALANAVSRMTEGVSQDLFEGGSASVTSGLGVQESQKPSKPSRGDEVRGPDGIPADEQRFLDLMRSIAGNMRDSDAPPPPTPGASYQDREDDNLDGEPSSQWEL